MAIETVKIPEGEIKTEVVTEITEGTMEPTAAEQRAIEDGWVPKDQWKGDPEAWRPAKEFNDRGELFTRIKAQSKELADLKEGMQFLTKQHKDQFQAGVKATLEQLKTAQRAALEDGNIVAAEEIRDKIDKVKEEAKEAAKVQVTPSAPQPSSTFTDWHDKNKWYMKDDDLTAIADRRGAKFKRDNPGSSEADMLAYVTKEVRENYPDKFQRSPPSPSGSGRESPRGRSSGEGSGKYKDVEDGMSDEHRSIMKTIIKTTGMTKEEYLKQYAS